MNEINSYLSFYPIQINYDSSTINNNLNIIFDLSLTGSQESILNSVVSNHLGDFNELAPFFGEDNYDTNSSYLGYGVEGACKILRIISSTGNTYDGLWAEGNQSVDKIWSARTLYNYL